MKIQYFGITLILAWTVPKTRKVKEIKEKRSDHFFMKLFAYFTRSS